MIDTKERWGAVAEAITARMAELALSQADLVRTSGVSDATIRKLMRGEAGNYRPDRLAKVSQALGWGPDGIDRIRAGTQPNHSAPAMSDRLDRLEAQMQEVLAIVRRLDTTRDDG